MRKLVIGLVVLGALLALYMGYARIGGTPPPGLSVPEPLPVPTTEMANEPNAQAGRIGPTVVGAVGQTRFFHRDENGRRDREFGFEVFLHKQGDRWRFTNPYMKLFLRDFECHVTADAGEGQVQSAFGQVILNDALFQGNVVIHIIPPKRNDPRECLIYLDDVSFVAEKSLFSSPGPVQFVSRSAMLSGVGMDLIYDGLQSRLELFRIIARPSLRLHREDIALFSGDKDTTRHERRETQGRRGEGVSASDGARDAAGAAYGFYECILHDNVTIETPELLAIAQDRLSIVEIPWMRSEAAEQPGDRGATKSSEPSTSELSAVPAAEPLDTKPVRQITFDPRPTDLVAACAGSLVVAPKSTSDRYADPNATARPRGSDLPSLDARSDRQQVAAWRMEYNQTTGDGALIGPVLMLVPLDPNSLAGPALPQAGPGRAETRQTRGSRGPPIPMKVTAQTAVHYISALNQVVFEGDCVANAEKADPNIAHAFRLSAPTFAVELMEDANAPASKKAVGKAVTLKRFWTDGGPASMVVSSIAGRLHPAGEGRLLGRTRVLASQLEYEAADKLFTAHGPGELQLNNAWASSLDPNVGELGADRTAARNVRDKPQQIDPNVFGFDKPCYALLWGFDLLTFASETNRIVVAAKSQPILIDYIPVVNGKYGQPLRGDVGHLDLTLRQTATGRMELASLIASKGVTYKEDQTTRFIGGTLTYDREHSLLKVVGDDTQPCYLNGAPVDQIEIDTTTGILKKTELRAPGIFQGKR